jgi:hypothetical protein
LRLSGEAKTATLMRPISRAPVHSCVDYFNTFFCSRSVVSKPHGVGQAVADRNLPARQHVKLSTELGAAVTELRSGRA